MSAFSIGKEFGLDAPPPSSSSSSSSTKTGGLAPLVMTSSPQPRGKDTLMEALMDLEDDGLGKDGEVVFGGDGDKGDTDSPAVDEVADIDLPWSALPRNRCL